MQEKDLFEPIKLYFESLGYEVDGEVKDLDMVLVKEDISVAVELKKTIDFKVIQQSSLRQKYVDLAFVGIFMPKNLRSKAFQNKVYLLKRLGIGLLLVSSRSGNVELYSEPIIHELDSFKLHNKYKGQLVLDEFKKRKLKSNTGGVRKSAILTGYKEESLLVLDALYTIGGSGTCKQIREITSVEKTTSILYNNFNGWFTKLSKGKYCISELGYQTLETYKDEISRLKNYSNS